MLFRTISLSTKTALLGAALAGLVACAPDAREGDADAGGGAPADGAPDGTPFIDGGPLADAGDAAFIVYVHSRDTLYTMDPTTFEVTLVGAFGTGTDYITDLAVSAEGTIYAISQTKLYTVNAQTGVATLVAPLSPSSGNVGLTFLPSGELLATDSAGGLRRIDPANGQVTELAPMSDMYATAGDLVAVEDGTMYNICDKGAAGVSAFADNLLVKVNPTTGQVTEVGAIGASKVFGAAFINGKVLAFTSAGQVVEIDPLTGAGTIKKTYASMEFWGAGVTPLVPGVE